MSAALDYTYRYPGESRLAPGVLHLATSGGDAAAPLFFSGALTEAKLTAELLRALSRIVGARFFTPPNMLAQILAQADPVVTSGGGMLRFEGFSACASAHARVDLAPGSYDAQIGRSGTTNVDFNAPMRAALASVRQGEAVRLDVGREAVTLQREESRVTERKVVLPLRWLRSFVEVQAYHSRMKRRFELPAAAALRFLRSLPRASTARHAMCVVPSAGGVRLSATPVKGGLALSGAQRLRVLEDLAPFARRMVVYGDDDGQASAWELDFGAQRYTLTVSDSTWRGFSGEGQALRGLATRTDGSDGAVLAKARAALHWQATLRAEDLATTLHTEPAAARSALEALGASGLVGFDLATATYFHRVLPFDLERIETTQPRLAAARALVAGGKIERRGEEILVPGSGVVHRVRVVDGETRCTCPWFSRHQATRGPCKHVLAAQMVEDDEEAKR